MESNTAVSRQNKLDLREEMLHSLKDCQYICLLVYILGRTLFGAFHFFPVFTLLLPLPAFS